MKKGVIEIQFNWMYVLIIGALILAFFVGVANKIRVSSQQSLDYDVLTYLDEIFVGIETSSQVEHDIRLPGTEIVVDCQEYTIEGSRLDGNSLQNRIVFSPDLLQNEIASYTLYWEAPFKTSFFLFMTSKDVRYVIVDDGNYAQRLKNALPQNMPFELVSSLGEFEEQNNYKIRVISFGTSPPSTAGFDIGRTRDNDVSAIVINPDSTPGVSFPDGIGELRYYTFDGNSFVFDNSLSDIYNGENMDTKPLGYLNKASLFGAIYAEDSEMYDCNMAKGINRLDLMSEILKERAGALESDPEVDDECDAPLNEAQNLLTSISGATYSQSIRKQELEPIFDASYPKTQDDKLEGVNKRIQRLSCPMVY